MDEKQLLQSIDTFIEQNRAAIIRDIGRLVGVKSLEEAALPGAPFGAGPRKALDTALQIAGELGLATNDGDGYVGWAQTGSVDGGYIATITHVDVVPEGEGWHADPYTLQEKDGWLIGRGVTDDKGAGVLCLYAARFLQDAGLPLRYGLRVLLGCNEESGMGDVDYYLQRHPAPLFCFSPDADFPLCNGEKGNFGGSFVSPKLAGNLLEFNAGLAFNVIPEKASCLLRGDAAAMSATDRVSVQAENGAVRLTAKGVGGHSAHPEGTLNAIGVLVRYLMENKLCSEEESRFLALLARLHQDAHGSGLGVDCTDDMFGPLTINGGVVALKDGVLSQTIDIRYPTCTNGEKLGALLSAAAGEHGAAFAPGRNDEPFYIPADAPPIQALLTAYNDVTGQDGQPFTMGGGTYARHFPKAVSFGPEVPGTVLPDFAGPVHGPNEAARIDDLMTALKIYILSIWRLQALEL